MSNDWHLFDTERELEVKAEGNMFKVRRQSDPDQVVTLTAYEFNQLREDGPNPKGLD